VANKDEIKELFSNSFEGFEKEVDPGLWDKIQNNLNQPTPGNGGQTATAGKTGLVKAIVIGTVSIASITGGILFFNQNTDNETKKSQNETPIVSEPNQNSNELVVVDNNNGSVEMIESSEDPVIVEHKEEIKQGILENVNDEVINDGNINDLLDQDLLDQLANAEKNKSDNKHNNIVNENVVDGNNDVKENNPENLVVNDNKVVDHKQENKKQEEEIYLEKLANVLTPNGDNMNDFLVLNHKGIAEFNLIVASETGKLMYEKTSATIKWNGTSNTGNVLKAGDYKIIIVATAKDGSKYVRRSYFYIRK
jgi:gliding motility-associated-like protein